MAWGLAAKLSHMNAWLWRTACATQLMVTACAPPAAEVWVTTGDAAKLLHREPDLRFGTLVTGVPTITLDEARTYQEMVGFGAALTDASAWLIQHRLTLAGRDSLLRELFGAQPGLGFSFARIDMGASDFSLRHYSYDDMPAGESDTAMARFSIAPDTAETIPILKRALEINPRLRIMASPWSAPGWMKSTGSMIKGSLRPEFYPAYARYFAKFIEAYASHGIPIYAVSIVNEPHFEPADYPGMRFDPPARAAFVGAHLGPLLQRSGIRTRILDWDHNWDQPESPLRVLADTAARRFVSGVAWHCYGGDVSAQGQVHDAFPDKDAYFTECSGGNWAPKFGDNLVWTVRTLVVGATRNWARGVLMWNLALDEKHGPHTGGCGDCRGVVTIDSVTGAVKRNEEYYALGHASRFVRPGAYRVESTTGVHGLESVAFRNPDRSFVLIVVNPAAEPQAFAVSAGSRSFGYTLPGGAVATFRWK